MTSDKNTPKAPGADRTIISVDAMGGDLGPAAVVAGISNVAAKNPEIGFIISGDMPTLKSLLADKPDLANHCEIRHAEEIVSMDDIFSKEQEINIYRIIQECCNNIIKHSNASAARIVIQKKGRNIEITVFDNGKGFDLEKNKDIINSLGLKSIRERVKYLKGTVKFESKLNAGTKIILKIAYEQK